MKAKPFHQSLYQEILALGDEYSSFSHSEPLELDQSQITSSNIHNNLFSQPSKEFTIKELEDEIIKMQVEVSRNRKKDRQEKAQENRINTQTSRSKIVSSAMTRRNSCETSMYEKSIRKLSEEKYRREKKLKEKESRELSQCTYQPEINSNSQMIMEKLDRRIVKDRSKSRREQIQKKRKSNDEEILKECSFQPHINKKIMYKEEKKNVFDELYEESKIRQQKLKMKHQKQQIRNSKIVPVIDKISKNIMENSNFEERLIRYEKQKIDKNERRKIQQEKENNCLYKPKINPSSHSRNSDNLPIGEHLYLQRKKKQQRMNKEQSRIYTNRKSEKVYEQKKFLTFYRIFILLDDDQDGFISMSRINLHPFPREIIKILYPLLEELEVMEVDLTENEFIESIDRLFKTLSVHEKNTLLSFPSCAKQQEASSFQPKINEKSRRIAEEMQRSKMSIYEYCSIKEEQKLKQLQSERVEQSRRQLKECTFQPKIIDSFSY